jgi:para-nitrobenzyl esterase
MLGILKDVAADRGSRRRIVLVGLFAVAATGLGCEQDDLIVAQTAKTGPSGGSGNTQAAPPTVQIEAGALRGISVGDADQFLGIPYAAPPVGALRFKPPQQPVASWQGERDATAQHDTCSQLKSNDSPRIVNEDCLYLNIYRPKGTSSSAKLPVLFHIHGGGFSAGRANNHDGSKIAHMNNMVVVMVEYRLNAFGFLALPSLTAESSDGSSGNYGLMDQQAGLRWVKQNIAAFGGNPDNVTISGQSAGAGSVCEHIASPTAKGLFHKAIIMSGNCYGDALQKAETNGAILADRLGCSDPATAATCVRGKSAEEILTATDATSTDTWSFRQFPNISGDILPAHPAEAVKAGTFNHVPVMIGTVHDEWRAIGFSVTDQAAYEKLLNSFFPAGISAIIAEYRLASFDHPEYAAGAVITDSGVRLDLGSCSQRRQAAAFSGQTPTFYYEFNDRNIPLQLSLGTSASVEIPPGLSPGAYHAGDLAYTVGFALVDALTPKQQFLSDEIIRYWGAFAASGAPNVAGQAAWPAYTDADQKMVSFEVGGSRQISAQADFAKDHHCEFWDAQAK